MSIRAFVDTLEQQGLDAAEAARKRSLYEWLIEAFPAFTSRPPTSALWVPGRLEVFGKHTDYAGGHSLIGTVPRGFGFVGDCRDDAVVNMKDVARHDSFAVDAGGTGDPQPHESPTGWRRYAATVVRRLSRNFPGAPLGLDIAFASDLPPASGMSSSSALMVGLAEMLVTRAGIRQRPEWTANIRTPSDAAGYYACIENGMSFGTLSGDAGVGTHGGSEDHIAILCGKAGELAAWSFVPARHVASAGIPESWTFVVAASGVAARKTGEAKESYNRLSREAAALLGVWNSAAATQHSVRDAIVSDAGASEQLLAMLRALREPGLEERLTHFLREDARVLEALQVFQAADGDRVGALAEASQRDAETLLHNQVPETIALTRSARRLGAFAASSFGAGFGGSVWALIERDRAPLFAAAWLTEYRHDFPERTAATTFISQPGPGVLSL
jgi:galactokinase